MSTLTEQIAAAESRLLDLVRHQRGALHDEGLISDEEYAALAAVEGSPARLESYDKMCAEVNRLNDKLKHTTAEELEYLGQMEDRANIAEDDLRKARTEMEELRKQVAHLEYEVRWERDVVVPSLERDVAYLESPTGAREVLADVVVFRSVGHGWVVDDLKGQLIGLAYEVKEGFHVWQWESSDSPPKTAKTKGDALRQLSAALTAEGYRVDYSALPEELRAAMGVEPEVTMVLCGEPPTTPEGLAALEGIRDAAGRALKELEAEDVS